MAAYRIKPIGDAGLTAALNLVWEVFNEFQAPDYEARGVEEFKEFIRYENIREKMYCGEILLWGSFDKDRLIGVIAVQEPAHISLLFVDKAYHRNGVARGLVEQMLAYCKTKTQYRIATVNASPYALKAYERMGFEATDAEREVNGIRFIPMKRVF
jgi:GNAT superfamily N-acetyltransferase